MGKAAESAGAEKSAAVLDITRMKERFVDKALKAAELAPASGVSFAHKVEVLDEYYRKTTAKDELIACPECGGRSSDELESCPFCGKKDEPKSPREAATNGASTALTVVQGAKGKVLSTQPPAFNESALDAVNRKIDGLKHDMAQNWWQLGRVIREEIFATELWKARQGEEGRPRYRSFEQWVKAEHKISSNTAYAMMDVAEHFSAEQVRRMGWTKLDLVLTAPEVEQDDLVKEIEKGASHKEIREKVKKAREKHGVQRRQVEGRKKIAGGRKAGSKVTAVVLSKPITLQLYARPDKKLTPGEVPDKRAKRLSDLPTAIWEFENGSYALISVLSGPSGWKLKIEPKRVEAEA